MKIVLRTAADIRELKLTADRIALGSEAPFMFNLSNVSEDFFEGDGAVETEFFDVVSSRFGKIRRSRDVFQKLVQQLDILKGENEALRARLMACGAWAALAEKALSEASNKLQGKIEIRARPTIDLPVATRPSVVSDIRTLQRRIEEIARIQPDIE